MVSLSRRLNTAFLFIVVGPLLLVSLIMSSLYIRALLDIVGSQTRELMRQVSQSVENEVNSVSVLSATVLYDNELRTAASLWADASTSAARFAATTRLGERLNSIFTFSNRFGAIVLYMKDGTVLPASNYPNLRPVVLADQAAYREAKAGRDKVVIADNLSGFTDNGGSRFILSAITCPSEELGGRAIDAIVLMFRVPYLDQFLSVADPSRQAGLVILAENEAKVVADFTGALTVPDAQAIMKASPGSSRLTLGGKPYLVNLATLDVARWVFLLAMDQESITKRIVVNQWYLVPVLALMTGLFFLYSWVLSSGVTRPIAAVVGNMRRFTSNLELTRVDHGNVREIATLSSTFDAMVAEIGRLDEERRGQAELRLAAEIQALQFQINPHFVANTLNSIRMMALAARNDSIREMTQSLIRILADSYAHVGPFTSLAGEIENVRSYVSIMKIRFGEHFVVDYDLEPETLGYRVLRMCLQPLVENSVIHGFAGLARQGKLRIAARRTDTELLILVEDNGVGMDDEAVTRLLQGRGDQHSAPEGIHRIGLTNIHERLKLNFGAAYGLQVTSRPDQGTVVRVAFPLKEWSE
jgi:two-component system sensor histidine kinase YesM